MGWLEAMRRGGFARRLRAAAVLGCSLLGVQLACAITLNVAPVRVVLTPERHIASLTLGNLDDDDIAVQAEVLLWKQENGQDSYQPTKDIIVNPSIFKISGRGRQIIRLGLQAPRSMGEGSYRIFLQQLPREQMGNGGASVKLQTLLRISVPIFVPPTEPHQDLAWRLEPSGVANQVDLVVDNRGNEHVQLTQVALRRPKGEELARSTVSKYILPGTTATLPLKLPPGRVDGPLELEAATDARVPIEPVVLQWPRGATTP